MNEQNHVALWNRCLEIIKDNVTEQAFTTWFQNIVPLKFKDKTLTIQVETQYVYEFLEANYIDLLRSTIYRVLGEGTKLMYTVKVVKHPVTKVEYPSDNGKPAAQPKTIKKDVPSTPYAEIDSQLKPEYNFDTFIEGTSNKLSRSVGEAIAENPTRTTFNPLFLYGASGVGKTHLINAIGAKIKELHPEKRVLYVSAHLFQVQYTDSVRNNTVNDFIKFYQTIDVLIVDDIQEFAGVTRTQNTFFHIFNHLQQNGKQLILSSDRSPAMLQGMEERMITRFKWGMVAELEKPTIELRKDILRSKIKRDGLKFPEEVISFIAENVCDSVRDLEGIIISIMAHATIYNREVDLDLAQRIVRKVVNYTQKEITIEDIINTVSEHFNISTALIRSASRKREVVQARQVAMFLAKTHTELSSARIGSYIGNRDHATVLHACKLIKDLKEVDKTFNSDLDTITSLLTKKGK